MSSNDAAATFDGEHIFALVRSIWIYLLRKIFLSHARDSGEIGGGNYQYLSSSQSLKCGLDSLHDARN